MDIAIAIAQLVQLLFQGFQMGALIALMNRFVDGSWLYEQARKWSFTFDIDLMKYSEKIYDVFVKIVNGTLFTPEIVNGLMTRLYLLIGILIFFRIAITMIRYVVAPETFLDDKAGAGSLVKRVVLGCIIIVATPLIFNIATGLQSAILEDKIIERIILPDNAYKQLVDSDVNTGKRIAMMTHLGFFNWNSSIPTSNYSSLWNNYSRIVLYEDLDAYQNIAGEINKHEGSSGTVFNDSMYVFSYTPVIATLAVGYILFTFVKYAMEIALRSFKLVFLQLISPFVIINYMLNPASEESMRKWVRTTVSTYLIMFIRIMTLWFIALIAYYMKEGVPTSSSEVTSLLSTTDPLVKSVIILALFAFLKDLPKLFSEMLNLDLQENETITGLMRQGFGIVKGFAMARIGQSFAKQQMVANSIGAGLGAVSGALSGINDPHNVGFFGKASGAMNGIGEMSSPLVGNFGHATSSSLGATILSPLSNQASLAQANWNRNVSASGSGSRDSRNHLMDRAEEKSKNKKDDKNYQARHYKDDNQPRSNQQPTNNQNGPVIQTVPIQPQIQNINELGATINHRVTTLLETDDIARSISLNLDNTMNLLDGGVSNPIITEITNNINKELRTTSSNAITKDQVIREFANNVSDMRRVTGDNITGVSQRIINGYMSKYGQNIQDDLH